MLVTMSTPNKAEAWDKRYAEAELVWSQEPNQYVVEYLSDLPVGKMLDLGGGEGRNALWFASRGWQAENSDFSAVAVDKFLQRAEQAGLTELCTGTVGDATNSQSCVTRPVDLSVLAYLQLLPADLGAALGVAMLNTRRGGTVFGVWHARENVTRGFGGPPARDLNPSMMELRAACEDLRLNIRTLELRERAVHVEGQDHIAIDVVLVAIID